jgi:hypothetical protein
MDIGAINESRKGWIRMPDGIYSRVSALFDEVGICRGCRDYVPSGHPVGSSCYMATKNNKNQNNQYFVFSCSLSPPTGSDLPPPRDESAKSLTLPLMMVSTGATLSALVDTGAQGQLLISRAAAFKLKLQLRQRPALSLRSFSGAFVQKTNLETLPVLFQLSGLTFCGSFVVVDDLLTSTPGTSIGSRTFLNLIALLLSLTTS